MWRLLQFTLQGAPRSFTHFRIAAGPGRRFASRHYLSSRPSGLFLENSWEAGATESNCKPPGQGQDRALGCAEIRIGRPSLLNQPSHTSLPGSCRLSMSRPPSAPPQLGYPRLWPVPAIAGTRPVTGNFTSIAFVCGHELQNPGCVLFFLLFSEPCTSPPILTVAWCMPGGPGESSWFQVAEALKT